jgi:hypothetical protein
MIVYRRPEAFGAVLEIEGREFMRSRNNWSGCSYPCCRAVLLQKFGQQNEALLIATGGKLGSSWCGMKIGAAK